MSLKARAAALSVIMAVAVACSGEEGGAGSSNGDDEGAGGGDGTDDGLIFQSGDGGFTIGNAMGGFEACATETVATEAVPLDIYIMFDRSCSMSCPPELVGDGLCCPGDPRPRIDQVRAAVESFLRSPDSYGIGVGIGYFGYFEPGQTSCNPGDYATADVEIAPLPDSADALIESLSRAEPVGETPTGAAVRGACDYARGWKTAHPGHSTVILLVTDGKPEAPLSSQQGGCSPTIDDAAAATAECFNGTPSIPTYVLGVSGQLENLQSLAESGGTGSAYLVGANTDVTNDVLAALSQIRDAAVVPCDFQVPPAPEGESIDPALVNVTFEKASGSISLVASVGSRSGCGAEGGWYYEDPAFPSVVKLCESTCDEVTANLIAASVTGRSARIDLQYGCNTVVVTR